MIKKLRIAVGTILLGVGLSAIAAPPQPLVKMASATAEIHKAATSTDKNLRTTQTGVQNIDRSVQNNNLAIQRYAKPAELGILTLGEPAGEEVLPIKATARLSAMPLVQRAPAVSKAGQITSNSLVAKDKTYQGSIRSAAMQLEKVDGENAYELTNVYGLGEKIKLTIDLAAGTVDIPAQVMFTHSTYGDVSFCPMEFSFSETGAVTGMRYSTTGSVKGTIDDQGNIAIGGWGLLFTSNEKYKDRGYNFMISSEWKAAKLKATGKQVTSAGEKDVEYSVLIEQTGDNSATLYCLSGVTGEILYARLGSDKSVTIAPQQIYNNMMYGPFFIYNAYLNENNKYVVDYKNNLVGSAVSDNKIDFGGWAIAARALPTLYVGYINLDMKVEGPHGLVFPKAGVNNFAGTGSLADPWLIKNYSDIENLAKLVNAGESFKDKYLALAGNIDMKECAPSNYVPVGTPSSPFQGTFDGKNFTISNFYANGIGFANTGLFGVIGQDASVKNIVFDNARVYSVGDNTGILAGLSYGRMENIQVKNSKASSDGELLGGIAGGMASLEVGDELIKNAALTNSSVINSNITGIGAVGGLVGQGVGSISNCSFEGSVNMAGYISSVARDAGGIVGALVNGSMENCYSAGFITDSYGMAFAGGVVARVIESAVKNCFNSAIVQSTRISSETETYTGGVAAYGSGGSLTNCYNGGTVFQPKASQYVGGIIGYLGVGYQFGSSGSAMINKTIVTNCLNYGQVVSATSNPKKGIYGGTFVTNSWDGEHPEDACLFNSHYDASIQLERESKYGLSTADLISGQLPKDFDAAIWQATAGRYPMLKSFGSISPAIIATVPVILRAKDTATKVKVGFTVTAEPALTWAISDGETYKTDTEFLTFSDNKFTIKDQYKVASIVAMTTDGRFGKLYSLSLVPKVFEGEGTEEDPYQLKTVADWEKLDYALTSARQTHEDDYFAMTADVDFNYSETFRGVGYGTNASVMFEGKLDGRNHKVSKLKIAAAAYTEDNDKTVVDHPNSTPYTGLFSVIGYKGEVKNVIISADCDIFAYSYAGSIAGASLGKISGCRNYADIKAASSNIGGIIGLAGLTSVTTGCYNAGRISTSISQAGGIAGYANAGAKVDLCQNDGDIAAEYVNPKVTSGICTTVGGILGANYATVTRCVNNGTITAKSAVGGIVGLVSGNAQQAEVSSSVNNGFVSCLTATNLRGAIAGTVVGSPKFENNFYDGAVNVNGATQNQLTAGNTSLSTSEITSGQAPQGVDVSFIDFAAGSYPVLKEFKDEVLGANLRKLYINFAPKQVRTNISEEIALSAQGAFSLKVNNGFSVNASRKLTVAPGEDVKVLADTLMANLDGAYKEIPIGYIASILKGQGTAEDPYLIETPADWNKLSDFMIDTKWEYEGSTIKIVNDLDFEGDSIRALAVSGVNLQAVLDGNGKTIKNYVYNNSNQIATRLSGPNRYIGRYIGIVGTLGSAGVIKNLTFKGDFVANQNIAGIVGDCYGTLDNVVNQGTVANTSSNAVAGIVYRAYKGARVSNCVFEGTATVKTNYLGGIVYEVFDGATVENCVNKGSLISGTSGLAGIAYYNDGMIRNCVNKGTFASSGTGGIVAGIVHTLRVNGSLEDCHNESTIDYGEKGGTLYGVFASSTKHATGHILRCYNTGDIIGKADTYGFGGTMAAGLTISDCYNTGEVSSLKYGAGFLKTVGGSTSDNKDFDRETIVRNCYNTGDVSGQAAKVAGFAYEGKVALVEDCYNAGDVTTLGHTGLCAGGLFGTMSTTTLNRCFNLGDVLSSGNAVGGLTGYAASESRITNCFNLGNVTSTYEGTNTNGNAGGLFGYISTAPNYVENSFNMGTVTGRRRVGGISAGMFAPDNYFTNVYNTGKVICTGTDKGYIGEQEYDMYFWSGTIFTGSSQKNGVSYFINCKDVYYDKTVNPTSEFRHITGSEKTTQELSKLEMGTEYVSGEGYPYHKYYKEKFGANHIAGAMLLLSTDSENFDEVVGKISLIAPEGAVWKAVDASTGAPSTALEISGDTATPKSEANVILTVSDKSGVHKKDFVLKLKPSSSGIEDAFAGKTVDNVTYYDLNGRQVERPVAGNIYVVRTIYTDGTMKVSKVVARD